ncbi:MAG: hypothetical protein LQ345_001708 [Seirophora villosa]|nr:MAG: hypothetical protein LQ345_001708 [Seirophora villosa]
MTSMDPMEALSMTKAECRTAFLRQNGEQYDKIVVGAIIILTDEENEERILVLKRAAHEEILPNIWEIPGGKAEDTDATILDALKREVHEETSLTVTKVYGAVTSFGYRMKKVIPPNEDGGEEETVWSSSLQLNFACEVAEPLDLAINPEEHSESGFVHCREVFNRELEMTEQMRAVVLEALSDPTMWRRPDLLALAQVPYVGDL